MHLDHKAGDKLYIDFAGSKLQVLDKDGNSRDVEVFVAILGCSQLTYVEAVLNEEFASFAEHYGVTVIPAHVYKPRDKSLVEGAVKLIYRSIYDLESLNAAIRSALEIHNNKPFSGRTYSRREQFEDVERDTLGSLNPLRYEVKKQSIVTVMKNGYIRLGEDVHYYSVPYKYIGKKVRYCTLPVRSRFIIAT